MQVKDSIEDNSGGSGVKGGERTTLPYPGKSVLAERKPSCILPNHGKVQNRLPKFATGLKDNSQQEKSTRNGEIMKIYCTNMDANHNHKCMLM